MYSGFEKLLQRQVSVADWGSISGPAKIGRKRLTTAAMFLRSCVAQALIRRYAPRHSLHASAYHREYNEGFFKATALLVFANWCGM